MKLWTPIKVQDEWVVIEDDEHVAHTPAFEEAKQICDEHNALVILQERGWELKRIVDMYFVDCPELTMREKTRDTPVQAILAADKWLKEQS